jgi:hypothetical protein
VAVVSAVRELPGLTFLRARVLHNVSRKVELAERTLAQGEVFLPTDDTQVDGMDRKREGDQEWLKQPRLLCNARRLFFNRLCPQLFHPTIRRTYLLSV